MFRNSTHIYNGSRQSSEYQTLKRKFVRDVSLIDRITYDFKNHHPRPMALGRRDLLSLIGAH